MEINTDYLTLHKILSPSGKISPKYKTWCVDDVLQHVIIRTSYLNEDVSLVERLYNIILGIYEINKCSCGTVLKFRLTGRYRLTYTTFCSPTCSNNDSDVKDLKKQKSIETYGVENISQSLEIKQKKKDTNVERRGVEYSLQDPHIREQIKKTNIEKYGVESPAQNVAVQEKMKQTTLERYGSNHFSTSLLEHGVSSKLLNRDWLINEHHNKNKPLLTIANELKVSQRTVSIYCNKLDIQVLTHPTSYGERELSKFIISVLSPELVNVNTKNIISPYELDICIPSLKIAFEYNGSHWHSELCGKSKRYHINKTNMCNNKGYRLIHILDNEWNLNKDITKSRITSILGLSSVIYARKCKIVELTKFQKKEFLIVNHLQSNCASSIEYGLMYENKIVACMTFGKSRFNTSIEYELIRYCNILNTTVVGGASKLFKHFLTQVNPSTIISYSDKRWSTGKLYTNLGFFHSHISSPNCLYFKSSDSTITYSRQQFQKHKLKKLLPIYDNTKSAWVNISNNGYNRIWDCGNDVYTWKK
jgi:very-short-patch-repair endonuclease